MSKAPITIGLTPPTDGEMADHLVELIAAALAPGKHLKLQQERDELLAALESAAHAMGASKDSSLLWALDQSKKAIAKAKGES